MRQARYHPETSQLRRELTLDDTKRPRTITPDQFIVQMQEMITRNQDEITSLHHCYGVIEAVSRVLATDCHWTEPDRRRIRAGADLIAQIVGSALCQLAPAYDAPAFGVAVKAEYLRAREKFDPCKCPIEAWAVLQEEIDELWDEIKTKERNWTAIVTECVQVAAMSLALAVEHT